MDTTATEPVADAATEDTEVAEPTEAEAATVTPFEFIPE